MTKLALLMFTVFYGSFTLANEFQSLSEIKIGEGFTHQRANDFPDENRPTTQFKVPNYGATKEIFNEYQVLILNNSKHVVVASAETSLQTSSECEEYKGKLKSIIKSRFTGFKEKTGKELNLRSVRSAFVKEGVNTFYTLNCKRTYGPFWILDFNIRGHKEDKELNAAWKTFFSKKR